MESIKKAVTKELKAVDPEVSINFTEYFNHVAVPDMVLRWPTNLASDSFTCAHRPSPNGSSTTLQVCRANNQ